MHNKLYENQNQWTGNTDPSTIFLVYATDLSLDLTKFETFLKNGAAKQKIADDKKDGETLGVNSTPTFFLNGKKLVNSPTYNNLKKQIDELLK